mmetsp:Transcript_67482/g.161938  ORF Transcript_67482/g.161938 Transcript_67482/m.161938 type:complete len:191 (+) Transcript_67482:77-649(+)
MEQQLWTLDSELADLAGLIFRFEMWVLQTDQSQHDGYILLEVSRRDAPGGDAPGREAPIFKMYTNNMAIIREQLRDSGSRMSDHVDNIELRLDWLIQWHPPAMVKPDKFHLASVEKVDHILKQPFSINSLNIHAGAPVQGTLNILAAPAPDHRQFYLRHVDDINAGFRPGPLAVRPPRRRANPAANMLAP